MSNPNAITYDCEGVRRGSADDDQPMPELCCLGCHEQAAYAERQFKSVIVRVCCALEDDLDYPPDPDPEDDE